MQEKNLNQYPSISPSPYDLKANHYGINIMHIKNKKALCKKALCKEALCKKALCQYGIKIMRINKLFVDTAFILYTINRLFVNKNMYRIFLKFRAQRGSADVSSGSVI